jgi:methanogenic corrinoid protein MtbC1
MYNAVQVFDAQALDSAYNDALSLYPVEIVTEQLLLPLLRQLGERWQGRHGGIAEEHFFASYMRNKIGARLHHQPTPRPQLTLLAACPAGEQHELGLLLFCLAAASHGIGNVMLGADTPISEIAHAARRSRVDGILLSASAMVDGTRLEQGMRTLVNEHELPVFVGGDCAMAYREAILRQGAVPLGNRTPVALQQLLKHYKMPQHYAT